MLFRRLAIGAILTLAATTGAHAQWRYCLAASDGTKEAYFSDPFPSNAPVGSLETRFGEMLKQSEVDHTQVQCPRATRESQIVGMRNDAIKFNKEFFSREAVELHWTPSSAAEATREDAAK